MKPANCARCAASFQRIKSQVYCSLACALWSRVEIRGPDECWPWLARATDQYGYGQFTFLNKRWRAPRVALLVSGYSLGDLHALHSCDNAICCNPRHLSAGTHLRNMREARARNRIHSPAGSRHFRAQFSEGAVREIKLLLRSGVPQADIAARFKVKRSTIADISAGRSWRNV